MKALITGITGQDGSYLAELLLEKDYEVHGIVRRSSSFNTQRINHFLDDIKLFTGDLSEGILISQIISSGQYDEVYNLAAQSDVRVSFDMPEYTGDIDALGVVRLLEAIRYFSPNTKFYQASSSEMYGGIMRSFNPRSPYACAKLYAYHLVRNYREGFNLFACNGILFNHESPRRGENFVTRKITKAVTRIYQGKQKVLVMGNIDAGRDWGYAPDYVEAMWMMLNHHKPGDYVIATGEMHTVREFLELAFGYYGLDYKKFVSFDKSLFRPTEVEALLGDYSKAKYELGWEPKVRFIELVEIMMGAEYQQKS